MEIEKNIQYIKAGDGQKIAYYVYGSKPQFILWCYGLVCSKNHFKYQIHPFAREFTNVIVDYRGHQNTKAPKSMNLVSLERIVQDIEHVVKTIGIPKLSVIGHSMGGNIAAYFGQRNLASIEKIVLINTPVDRPFERMFQTNSLEYFIKNFRILNSQYPSFFFKILET